VVVDPTIGTTTVGSEYEYYDKYDKAWYPYTIGDALATNRYTVPENMNGEITTYCYFQNYAYRWDKYTYYSYNYEVSPALYSEQNNAPYARLTKDEGIYDYQNLGYNVEGWYPSYFETTQMIPAGSNVWFGVTCGEIHPRFDYVNEKCYICYHDKYYEGADRPNIYTLQFEAFKGWEEIYSNLIKMSMYFTYTPMQNYVRTLTQGVRLADSRKLTANYNKALLQTARGNDKISRFETFFRNCFDSVKNNMSLLRLPVFMRITKENTGIASEIENKRELSRKCDETVSVNEEVKKNRGILRIIIENLTVTENASYPVLFICKIAETQGITDTIKQWGAYIRGLYDIADNLSANSRQGEFYRKENDNVQAVGSVFRGLLIFVRIFTTSFVRDFIIRRFLIAREELVLKSCITRELTIDSKIN